jgi:hypothetical protein
MKEQIQMTVKEAERLSVMRQIDKKILTIEKASEELGISIRQTKRIRKNYLVDGEKGLVSRKRGRQSNRKISDTTKSEIMALVTTTYEGFGPTLASEKLEERHQLKISNETLRKWMIELGSYRPKKRKEQRVYQRRTRRSRFGELLQGDGSPHAWFEDRGEKCVFLQFVDDATGHTTVGRFVSTETTDGYLEILQEHLKKHGRPLALYVDKHSIFRVNREELKKGSGITHMGKILKELDIELICAHSPQAKGRVERRNGVLQDRLIKEMKLRGISNMEEANKFLPEFLLGFNKRFGKTAMNSVDAHRTLREQDDLTRIFSRRDTRKLSKNLMFQHHGISYLIETKIPNRLRYATVEIRWRKEEPIEVEYNGIKLQYKKWAEITYEKPQVCDSKEMEIGRQTSRKQSKPSKHHPWR